MTPLRACIICGRPTATGSRCNLHPKHVIPRDRWYRNMRDRIIASATRCGICGEPLLTDPADPAVVDHIIPRAHGGGDEPGNLQAAHRSCNARKSSSLRPT